MIRIVIFTFIFVSQVYTQSGNIVPYIEGNNIGLQVSPMITGVKSSVSNQETELNITLFYHDKYDLREDEVLGIVEGRLISETPLSSFDLLKRIQDDNSLVLSNYGEQYRIYQEALSNFQTFQKIDPGATSNIDTESEEYYYYDEEYYYDDETNSVNSVGRADTENIYIADKLSQSFFAQSVGSYLQDSASDGQTNFSLDTLSTNQAVSGQELEYLIRIETLKKQYNQVVSQYNSLLSNGEEQSKGFFDPADPAESFTVMILGENLSSVWTKEFGLDGVTNYQSYNDKVWYLGYRIPITKKDVRLLYNIFTKNTKIQYIVKGQNGSIQFDLSSYFIKAMYDLVTMYAQGKLKRDNETSFPMLRNRNDESY